MSQTVLAPSPSAEGKQKKRSRFTVTFDPRSAERIERMAGDDDERKGEILRHAIALEDLYRQTIRDGGRFLIERSDKTIAEVVRT